MKETPLHRICAGTITADKEAAIKTALIAESVLRKNNFTSYMEGAKI